MLNDYHFYAVDNITYNLLCTEKQSWTQIHYNVFTYETIIFILSALEW